LKLAARVSRSLRVSACTGCAGARKRRIARRAPPRTSVPPRKS